MVLVMTTVPGSVTFEIFVVPPVSVPSEIAATLPELVSEPPTIVSVPKLTVLPFKSTEPPESIVSLAVEPNTLPAPVAKVSFPPESTSMLPGNLTPALILKVTLLPI